MLKTQPWTRLVRSDLKIQHEQCRDEGLDLAPFEAEFAALDVEGMEDDPVLAQRAVRLVDRTTRLKPAADWPFAEPSRLGAIRRARGPQPPLPALALSRDALLDKLHGGWTGRCCGCLLGKPVEGRWRGEIEAYLKAQGRWPLAFYFSNRADEAVRQANRFGRADWAMWEETITRMIEDDDTNYTATGLAILKQHGADFTPEDVGEFWLRNIPYLHVCTAERVAYRNLVDRIPAPDRTGKFPGRFSTANFRNVYREWIGAQIRADAFGYACPADPQRAAEYAWRDAAISHIRNGIYGEMWVAAMLAAAFVLDDVKAVIRAGLAQVPARSRFARDLEEVFTWRREGRTVEEAVAAVHAKWNEKNPHHWCHTNSNAQVVALALLWGEQDYGRTICHAVMPGFDTDCNGATAGSVLGVMLGRRALPACWADPIRDRLETGVHGYHSVSLTDMATETLAVAEKLRA